MLALPPAVKIYIASEPVDMRRGFDSLSALVRNVWRKDVYSGHLFVFVGRRRDRIKVLLFDHGGFVLYYKRLERGRFQLPAVAEGSQHIELDRTQLSMLLDGIDIARVKRPRRWLPPDSNAAQPGVYS